MEIEKSPGDVAKDVKIAARNGLTGRPETLNPVYGIEVAVKVSVEIDVIITTGGGDLVVVANTSGHGDKTIYTLIGGGVLSEPSEGKESLGAVVVNDKQEHNNTL